MPFCCRILLTFPAVSLPPKPLVFREHPMPDGIHHRRDLARPAWAVLLGLGMLWDGLYRNRWFMMIHNCSCWKWWVGSKSSAVLFHLFLRVSQTMLWFLVMSYHHPPAPPWDIGMAPPQSMFQCLPGLEKNSAWLAHPKVENDWDTFLKIGDGWKILLKWDRFKVGFQKENQGNYHWQPSTPRSASSWLVPGWLVWGSPTMVAILHDFRMKSLPQLSHPFMGDFKGLVHMALG